MHPLVQPAVTRYVTIDLTDYFPKIGSLRLRSLSAAEKTRYELGNREKHGSPEWVESQISRESELICLMAVDENGRPLFKATDALALMEQDGKLIEILYQAALRHAGLTLDKSIFDAIEAAEKKSPPTGSSSSPSS